MITRSTLKTLWFTGGGLLATWFAVTPKVTAPGELPAASAPHAVVAERQMTDDLTAQETKLREQLERAELKPSARNPFRFGRTPEAARPASAMPALETAPTVVPPSRPALTLTGIAEQKTTDGIRRTAIISGDGQLYLAATGDSVAGTYHVIAIDADAVTLRDETGAELRVEFK